ncbi:MAG: cob(I)yrinic acid a,c-diamide adenosyltransferase [Planctomycetota bacterium]|nr:MAG: cob(I)yrinic acid a,c-diamide adenosyltransferase [Planctomycetota bacterium]
MKIYSKTGDDGKTGLFGGGRVGKDDPRIEAYGTVDELNAAIGVARASRVPAEIDAVLAAAQNDLFAAGAELATPAEGLAMLDQRSSRLGEGHIARLEAAIDRFDERLAPLKEFILPGGDPAGAALHLARTICRRAERRVVTLRNTEPDAVSDEVIVYLNRLGDLLFVLARAASASAGVRDVPWKKE